MHSPVLFDENACGGCNICLDICPMDIFGPNPNEGKPPLGRAWTIRLKTL